MVERKRAVRLTAWSAADFWLLVRCNEPEMTRYLGGPESQERLAARQQRYEALSTREPAAGRIFRIDLLGPGEPGRSIQPGQPGRSGGGGAEGEVRAAGSIGFWEREWRGGPVYETGWAVLPEFQGRGLAAAALEELLAHIRAHGDRDAVHAFPGTDHPASNGVCRRAGFECLGRIEFEYPAGVPHPSFDWRLPLR
ncbi:GNAT family N-acetyltransferase [Streptomyces sp. cmx-4-9]|uniref:GNAT family N-acetyltransferase n=1 Tax=Streptomyces sp. cmx-4-9 TaxID=2790941 RepID=UPI00397EFE25